MKDELLSFNWPVHSYGYVWIDAALNGDSEDGNKTDRFRVLSTGKEQTSENWKVDHYDPFLKFPALFRTFADTEPTEQGILEFANRYGLLGGDVTIQTPSVSPIDGPFEPVYQFEHFSVWEWEIRWMQHAVSMWDSVREGDSKYLSEFIYWIDEDTVEFKFNLQSSFKTWMQYGHIPIMSGRETFSREVGRDQLSKSFPYGNVIQPALYFMQMIVNRGMIDRVSLGCTWSTDLNRPRLQLHPYGLIGALWLQFAQAIDGDKNFHLCSNCRKWSRGGPKSKRYCSDACRMQDYRVRKAARTSETQ